MRPLIPLLSLCVLGCHGPPAPPAEPDMAPTSPLVAARPYNLKVPDSYDRSRPTPLLIVLHGFGADGVIQDAYFGTSRYAEQAGYLCAYPDGTKGPDGALYWNATDACCAPPGPGAPDDVAYLDALISDVSAHYNVDPRRVYLAGHSNGGFMAYRMACDRAARIAGIVSLAGANWKDTQKCQPSEPVSVLQVHGDQDMEVPYDGGPGLPSARESVAFWVQRDGCAPASTMGPPLSLDLAVMGAQTAVERWGGCQRGTDVELWTMHGSPHVPRLTPMWPALIYGFLSAHPKP